MTRARYPARREAERNYQHKVDVPGPPGGFGMRVTEIHSWCHDHVAAGTWEEHAHSDDRLDADGIRIDFARFYFRDEADAERFRQEWLTESRLFDLSR